MKTSIEFRSTSSFAVKKEGKIEAPTVEQMERLSTLVAGTKRDMMVSVPAALLVLLGECPKNGVVTVSVPDRSLNWAAIIFDDGGQRPSIKINEGAILHAWLDAGAPLDWDGEKKLYPAPVRQKLARDAAGRYCRVN